MVSTTKSIINLFIGFYINLHEVILMELFEINYVLSYKILIIISCFYYLYSKYSNIFSFYFIQKKKKKKMGIFTAL